MGMTDSGLKGGKSLFKTNRLTLPDDLPILSIIKI
jgi:hypothetical protein